MGEPGERERRVAGVGSSGHGEGGKSSLQSSACFEIVYTAQIAFFCRIHIGEFFLCILSLFLFCSLSLSFTSCLARHKFSRVLPYDILPFSFLYPIAQSNDKPVYRPLNRQDSQDLLWEAEGN